MSVSIKYKPKRVEDVVFPNSTVEMQVQGFATGMISGNALFWGQPGNGKTTCCYVIARELGASNADIIFLNCSKSTSIDDIRKVENTLSAYPSWDGCGFHIVILDELDGSSDQAQKALKGMIEAYADYAMFFATTNHPEKIEEALRDRFYKICMNQIDLDQLLKHAKRILKLEGISVREHQLKALCLQANGSLRRLNQSLDWLILKSKMSVKPTSKPTTSKPNKKA